MVKCLHADDRIGPGFSCPLACRPRTSWASLDILAPFHARHTIAYHVSSIPILVLGLGSVVPAAGDCTSVQVLARRILNSGEVQTHSLVSISLYRENCHT
jgi:hypothetical protein